jgi:dTDP-4-dehydrorhamnose reductase
MLNDSEILITGAGGQLGTALRNKYPGAKAVSRDELDITNKGAVDSFDWSGIKYLVNAAAYTNVDSAETAEGRIAAWKTNAMAAGFLAEAARAHDLTMVHISTDYVFDGTHELHTEDEDFSPLSSYGASKAAGDVVISLVPKHYILRSSWVVGEGKNFVRSILGLGQKGIEPGVVADQFGRPTFAVELARAIDHLLTNQVAFGAYNASNGGDVVSWADLARAVYKEAGFNLKVSDTTAAEYFAGKVAADRPVHSAFDLSKIESTGFKPTDWREDLKDYIQKEMEAK